MAFPNTIVTWCSWLKSIAESNKKLCHVDGTNKRTHAYSEVWISSDPMARIDYRSLFGKMGGTIKYPHLVNLGPDLDPKPKDGNTIIMGRFGILHKIDIKNSNQEEGKKNTIAYAEEVSREVMAYIHQYFIENMQGGHLQAITYEPIGPIGNDNMYGVVVEIKYQANNIYPCYDAGLWKTPVVNEDFNC